MNTCGTVRIPIHCSDGITEKIEAVHDRITQRAYECWLNRRAAGQAIFEFWSAAERELLCKPVTEVREWGHGVRVEIACPEVEPSRIRLFMSRTELLALAPMNTPGHDRWLFRYVRFQNPLDHLDASAEYENGALRIAATLLDAPDERKIHFQVA